MDGISLKEHRYQPRSHVAVGLFSAGSNTPMRRKCQRTPCVRQAFRPHAHLHSHLALERWPFASIPPDQPEVGMFAHARARCNSSNCLSRRILANGCRPQVMQLLIGQLRPNWTFVKHGLSSLLHPSTSVQFLPARCDRVGI